MVQFMFINVHTCACVRLRAPACACVRRVRPRAPACARVRPRALPQTSYGTIVGRPCKGSQQPSGPSQGPHMIPGDLL